MKILLRLMLIQLLISSLNLYGQNPFFPTKNDFKTVVKLTSNENTFTKGVLYDVKNDFIIIQSFDDKKLYAYAMDSIAKIHLKKGPGFLKIGTPVFIGISSIAIGADLYAIVLGSGIEMIPASAIIIPFLAVPTAVVAGTISYVSSTRKAFDIDSENHNKVMAELKNYCAPINANYQYENGIFQSESKKRFFTDKRLGLNIYFGLNTKFTNIKGIAKEIVGNYEYKDLSTRQREIFHNYHYGISYDINSKWNVNLEINGDPEGEVSLYIKEPSEANGLLKFEFDEYTETSRKLTVNYTFIGENKSQDHYRVKLGAGLIHVEKDYRYELFPLDFMNVQYSTPWGDASNYNRKEADYGLSLRGSFELPLKLASSLSFEAYLNVLEKIDFTDYRMTYISTGNQIHFPENSFVVSEFGVKASLNFHL